MFSTIWTHTYPPVRAHSPTCYIRRGSPITTCGAGGIKACTLNSPTVRQMRVVAPGPEPALPQYFRRVPVPNKTMYQIIPNKTKAELVRRVLKKNDRFPPPFPPASLTARCAHHARSNPPRIPYKRPAQRSRPLPAANLTAAALARREGRREKREIPKESLMAERAKERAEGGMRDEG